VSFAASTLCVVSQRVFIIIVVVYFVIDSARKLLDTPSYNRQLLCGFSVACNADHAHELMPSRRGNSMNSRSVADDGDGDSLRNVGNIRTLRTDTGACA
jgi:hypothetical protein